ncbi:MAG: hypothetical protein IT208_06070 [Chthonomonadales bacterium]|nr:hypothetical protein [Chthonomonadales bacterium]
MRRWKYHTLVLRDLAIAESKLNTEGEKGWELTSVVMIDAGTARAFFKAPIEEEAIDAVHLDGETAVVAQAPFD